MKVRKPNTDQEASVTIQANGLPCQEYMLSPSSSATPSDPNTLECFIPISEGDILTIHATFCGTVLHGAFDFLADGSFVGEKRIEGGIGSKLKFQRRKYAVDNFFDLPVPEGWTSIYAPTEVVGGKAQVKELSAQDQKDFAASLDFNGGVSGNQVVSKTNKEHFGLGSLAIVISLNQKTDDQYHDEYASLTFGSWRDRLHNSPFTPIGPLNTSAVMPTHELSHIVTDNEVHYNRQSKHRRHLFQTRFGDKPWAKFIFYYRSPMAIEGAGCVLKPNRVVDLEPWDERKGKFVFLEEKKRTPWNKKVVVEDGRGDENDDDDQASNLFVTPPPPEPQENKMGKAKLFGLTLPKNVGSATGQTFQRVDDDGTMVLVKDNHQVVPESTPAATIAKSVDDSPSTKFLQPHLGEVEKDGDGDGPGKSTVSTLLREMNDGKTTECSAEVESSLTGADDAMSAAQLLAPYQSDHGGASEQQTQTTLSMPSVEMFTGESVEVEVKQEVLLPANGERFTSLPEIEPVNSAAAHRRENCTETTGLSVPKTDTSPADHATASSLAKPRAEPTNAGSNQTTGQALTPDGVETNSLDQGLDVAKFGKVGTAHRGRDLPREATPVIKAEPVVAVDCPQATTIMAGSTRQEQNRAVAENNAASTTPALDPIKFAEETSKRPCSPSTTSGSSPPTSSKRPRFSTPSITSPSLASRRSELQAQLSAKRAQKAAARQALEEQRKRREEEEKQWEAERKKREEEMAEIERFERILAQEDEEIQGLEREREEELASLREWRRAREEEFGNEEIETEAGQETKMDREL